MLTRPCSAAFSVRHLPSSCFISSLPRRHRSTSTATPEDTYDDVKPFSEMPSPSGMASLPYIGFFFLMKSKYNSSTFNKLIDELHEKHGRTFKMQLLGETVFTEHPSAIADIYKHEGKYPSRKPITIALTYAKQHNRDLGVGLIDGEPWQHLRSASQKFLLRKSSASIYVKYQNEVANDLLTRMKTLKYTPEEFRYELFRYATESICTAVFRKRMGFLEPDGATLTERNVRYLRALMDFFEFIIADQGPSLYKWFPTKFYRDFKAVADIIYRYSEDEMMDLLASLDKEMQNGTHDDRIPCLGLELRANTQLPERAVNAICTDFVIAGTDSTAKNIDNFLLNLALNPEKQEKLYDEVVNVVGPKGTDLEGGQMEMMPYYRACMKESFRIIYPINLGSARVLPEDTVIDGYLVPKGTLAIMNNKRLLLNEDYFEKPLQYIPERWIRDEEKKRDNQYPPIAFLPFSYGPRNCIGRRFAEQEIWLCIMKIIQNFRVGAPGQITDYEMKYSGFGQADQAVKFTFSQR